MKERLIYLSIIAGLIWFLAVPATITYMDEKECRSWNFHPVIVDGRGVLCAKAYRLIYPGGVWFQDGGKDQPPALTDPFGFGPRTEVPEDENT